MARLYGHARRLTAQNGGFSARAVALGFRKEGPAAVVAAPLAAGDLVRRPIRYLPLDVLKTVFTPPTAAVQYFKM